MMRALLNFLVILLLAFLVHSAAGILFYGGVSITFVSIFFLLVLAKPRTAFIWALLLGIFFEMISPFPPLSYLIATLLSAVAVAMFLTHFVSRRTVFGIVLSSAGGAALFEAAIYGFAKLGSLFSAGWVPTVDSAYGYFFLQRMIFAALISGIFFLFVQHFSPKVRGIILTRA